jgi:Ca2+-binding EF-hand superfamily protein
MKKKVLEDKLKECFKLMDPEKEGKISTHELRYKLAELLEEDEDFEKAANKVDKDKDGMVRTEYNDRLHLKKWLS